jgi:hypothetical protein
MLAIQEKLTQQLVTSAAPFDLSRLWQNVLSLPASAFSSPLDLSSLPGSSTSLPPTTSHPLFHHGKCQWPQCNQHFDSFGAFLHHLAHQHTVDERSAQQCRTQIELVESLENQLSEERARLQAMMVGFGPFFTFL